jgi:3-oxoacyl-[acyl-carrier protein] reductase
MGFDFNGKRVVVAGGSRGIGRSIALGFAQAGAAVSVCARNTEGLKAVEAELAVYGHPVHIASCDVADGEAISAYIAAAAEALGGSTFWSTTRPASGAEIPKPGGRSASRST